MSYTVSAYDVTSDESEWLYRLEGLGQTKAYQHFAHRAETLEGIGYQTLGFHRGTGGLRFGHNPNHPGRELELRLEGPKEDST